MILFVNITISLVFLITSLIVYFVSVHFAGYKKLILYKKRWSEINYYRVFLSLLVVNVGFCGFVILDGVFEWYFLFLPISWMIFSVISNMYNSHTTITEQIYLSKISEGEVKIHERDKKINKILN